MEPDTFDEIYQKVKPLIEKKNTNMHNAISAHARLCVTLRFLASGASYKELMYAFRMSVASISQIVPHTFAFDLGSPGSQSDGGIFKDGSLGKLCKSSFFPAPSKLGQRVTLIPYFLLGDDAFALETNLMKPFPHRTALGDEKVFNYRLSKARRIVENAFGLLCARFRILLLTIELDVANVMQVVRACVALHNFLLSKKDKNYLQHDSMDQEDELGNVTPGRWRNAVEDVCNIRNDPGMRSSTAHAREIRDDIKDYFFEEGSVDFQWKMTE